ncbi:hypothetical protein BGP78_09055 [Pseudoalteromonas sp. MSK9-3]|uniref:hypothetical protein n=1 Tax=Pseudoalteromonas sp. MSK9-3 TaxID=1897633 RepID=UPI000E6BB95A|nr:hypothetical protein [Pseudoalteromonas sp. MSK9-3]RJE77350.1 hypothetical protein BGP78_09055 [Pseudoalteromonas sp. MSK9-3]
MNKKTKVLILTDSLGLPRSPPEETVDDDVWIYKLTDAFSSTCSFRMLRQRALDSSRLIENIDSSLKAYKNVDFVILQVGIVDCYPRAISKENLRWINKTPKWVQNFIHKRVKANEQYYIERDDNRFVKPNEYLKNIEKLKNVFPSSKFLVVPIGPACESYAKKNSKLKASIEQYNHILAKSFPTGYLSKTFEGVILEDMYISDGHHLSKQGHIRVFNSLTPYFQKPQ